MPLQSMYRVASRVAFVLFALGANCYPLSEGIVQHRAEGETAALKGNGFMNSLYSCTRRSTPEKCYGGRHADSIQSVTGSVQSSYSALGRIAAVRIRFAATRLRSYGSEVEAELRVYKKPLSAQAIASLRGVGCNISDVTVHLHTNLGVFQSVISGTDLKEESWVPFRNLSQVYRSWTQKMSQPEHETEDLSFKMEVMGACNSTDAVLSAFAGSGDDHLPVLLLFSNDSTNDYQERFRVSRITANYKSKVQRYALTSQGACEVHYHQVNLSDYLSDIIEPLEYSLSYCAGACDSESPPIGTRAWIQSSEHQKDPAAVPPLRCVPERYGSLTVLLQRDNNTVLDTLLNFDVKSCYCA